MSTLMEHDLDVYRLMFHPLVLCAGERLFRAGGTKATLTLADAKTTATGVAVLTYESGGR